MKRETYLKALKNTLFATLLILFGSKLNAQCNANFVDSTCINSIKQFVSISTGVNNFTQYSWNFGDNTTGSGIAPAHTYSANGVYSVCLTITNFSPSCTSTLCKTVNITCVPSSTCNANFTFSNCVNGTMQFFNTSTNVSNQTAYSWNFGDNTFSFGNNPSHTYTANGTYTVCLTLTDSLNMCTSTKCKTVTINCIAASTCTANFSYSTCVNGNMQFFSTSSGVGNFTYYSWNFGDSSFGTGQSPNHTYSANGIYTVCLTIIDSTTNCNS
ncbi:MAG: PKD domain-containing protein, partial [Bacteroidia bacterium]|nr:PKD domain-containing protein [Bacteroidia bacterium]